MERQDFLLFGHDALDHVGFALLVDQELTDAAVPGSDVGEEFLQAFDAAIREGGDAFLGPVVDGYGGSGNLDGGSEW